MVVCLMSFKKDFNNIINQTSFPTRQITTEIIRMA
jgi:hypothetical protein